jgi:hypothetical protein
LTKKSQKIAKLMLEFIYTTKFMGEIVTAISRTSQLKVSPPLSKKVPSSKTARKNSHTMKKKKGKMIARNNPLIRTKRLFNRRCAKITTLDRTLS